MNADQARQATKRNNESPDERAARLHADQERQVERRQHESPDERAARLTADQERQVERRQNESPAERAARLAAEQERQVERRTNESPDERAARLTANQERQVMKRTNESPEERQLRLANARTRRQNAHTVKGNLYRAAVCGTDDAQPATLHDLGPMSIKCQYNFCQAYHFPNETGRLLHSCCHNGKTMSAPLSPYPDELRLLISSNTSESTNFRDHIRQYNNANAFASFGAKMKSIVGNGPYCFKISGEVYHLATSALVKDDPDANAAVINETPRYGQLFVYDPDAAVNFRIQMEENTGCHITIMTKIDSVLRQINPYADHYNRLHKAVQQEEARSIQFGFPPIQQQLLFVRNAKDDQRRYNAPVTNHECMYLIESGDGDISAIDLAVHPRDQRGCTRINQYSRHVDPMVFPVFFPSGDSGYTINAKNSLQDGKDLTALQFYSCRIAVRDVFNPIHYGGKLFQQFVVHAYCLVETQRLQYIKSNQQQLRVHCYQGLTDYLAHATDEQDLRPGNLVILPSTFIGGPRYMRQKYHDAMTIVRKFGRSYVIYYIHM